MDVIEQLDLVVDMVTKAKAMPMSASALVNRAELLSALAALRGMLPDELDQAREVLSSREEVVAEAEVEAEEIIEAAHVERARLVGRTEVAQAARKQAEELLAAAEAEAAQMKAEAEDYVDTKLATFEITLTKTLEAVERGRRKLAGSSQFDRLSSNTTAAVEPAEENEYDEEDVDA